MNDRFRRPDVPPRVRRRVVHIHVRRTALPRVTQVATDIGEGAEYIPLNVGFYFIFYFDFYFSLIRGNLVSPLLPQEGSIHLFLMRTWLTRRSRPEVPPRVRRRVAHTHVRRTAQPRVTQVATDTGEGIDSIVEPTSVRFIGR